MVLLVAGAVFAVQYFHTHDSGKILEESLRHEGQALQAYKELLTLIAGKSVLFEDCATRLIIDKLRHAGDVRKILQSSAD